MQDCKETKKLFNYTNEEIEKMFMERGSKMKVGVIPDKTVVIMKPNLEEEDELPEMEEEK